MFIELTDSHGEKFLVNKNNIKTVVEHVFTFSKNQFQNSTITIVGDKDGIRVRETYEEIKSLLEL